MIDNTTYLLAPGPDNCVLTTNANAADGTGLAWSSSPTLNNLSVNGDLNAPSIFASSVYTTYGIGVWGAAPPSTQPAFPGTATGTDAAVINAIVTFLAAYGFCASS
ncbi:MAG TPA: hypothetical protein VJY33_09875 [Isosphaeraceae bacterium]|nr:hypothetical protein [Isosphaeraceae bacterium]